MFNASAAMEGGVIFDADDVRHVNAKGVKLVRDGREGYALEMMWMALRDDGRG